MGKSFIISQRMISSSLFSANEKSDVMCNVIPRLMMRGNCDKPVKQAVWNVSSQDGKKEK